MQKKSESPIVELPEQSYQPSVAELCEPIRLPGTFEDAIKALVSPVKVRRVRYRYGDLGSDWNQRCSGLFVTQRYNPQILGHLGQPHLKKRQSPVNLRARASASARSSW